MEEINDLLKIIADAEAKIVEQLALAAAAKQKLQTIRAKIDTALKPGPIYRGNTG